MSRIIAMTIVKIHLVRDDGIVGFLLAGTADCDTEV